jgi:hypothetical protein
MKAKLSCVNNPPKFQSPRRPLFGIRQNQPEKRRQSVIRPWCRSSHRDAEQYAAG